MGISFNIPDSARFSDSYCIRISDPMGDVVYSRDDDNISPAQADSTFSQIVTLARDSEPAGTVIELIGAKLGTISTATL